MLVAFADVQYCCPVKRKHSNVVKPQTLPPKRYPKTQALMGATRPASGIKAKAHTPNKGSQTVLITRLSVNLCLNARRGTRRPH